jgi:hypothetical protein
MRRCNMCKLFKPEEEFAFRSLKTGARQDHCRMCHAAYRRAHYLRTKETYVRREIARMRGYRRENQARILEYLIAHPCVDCGEADPIVLDFDHRVPATKRSEVARLAGAKPWPQVLAEIAKCDVRCANCHRRRTARQFSWRRARPQATPPPNLSWVAVRPHYQGASHDDALDLRTCSTCHVAQPATEFAMKNARTGLRSTKCRSCQRAYSRQHYRENRGLYLDKAAKRNARERDRLAAVLLEYLATHPCVDCGSTDVTVLEFDHRDGAAKIATITALIRQFRLREIEAEIAKCDVRCANCHRRRTARQFNWTSRILREDDSAA